MKKKIVLGVLLAVIIVAAIGTYMYRHRFDKYEQSQEEQTAGIPSSKDMISAARPSSFSPLMAAIASAGLSRLSVKCSPKQMLFRGQPSTTERWTRQSRRLTNG